LIGIILGVVTSAFERATFAMARKSGILFHDLVRHDPRPYNVTGAYEGLERRSREVEALHEADAGAPQCFGFRGTFHTLRNDFNAQLLAKFDHAGDDLQAPVFV
jgi:hypothetical protein